MNTTGKIGWVVALVLAIGLGGMAYIFLLKGQTAPYADGRISVLLTADERSASLAEMRDILESVQEIMEDTIAGDFDAARARASSQGMSAFNQEDPAVIAKLPIGFKSIGLGLRGGFDDLATTLESTDSAVEVLDELSTLMLNCVACHQTYRLGIEGELNPAQE